MPPKAFLDLPTEIRVAIYKRVFAGAQIGVSILDRDGELTVKRMGFSTGIVHTALLETCSKIQAEVFPIMAGAIKLIIHFLASVKSGRFRFSSLDLQKLADLSYAPAFLMQIIPFIKVLAYTNRLELRSCYNMSAFPKLEVLTICHPDHGFPISLPHLNGNLDDDESVFLNYLDKCPPGNPKGLNARIAEAAQAKIENTGRLSNLKEFLNTRHHNVKVFLHLKSSYESHGSEQCKNKPGDCLCKRQDIGGLWEYSENYPTFESIIELSAKAAVTDKFLVWEGMRYDSYKDFWTGLRLHFVKHGYGDIGSLPENKDSKENGCSE